MRQRLAILGSTGSIGRQTLEVAASYPDLFEVRILTAGRNWELLCEQARRFDAPQFNFVFPANSGKSSFVIDGNNANLSLLESGHEDHRYLSRYICGI